MKLPMILLWKGTSAPVAPLLKGQRRKCSRHASILRRPCAYYSTRTLFTRCRLQCVTVMNINYQRSPETEQFITAKISGNTLKQGSRTRSVLRQRSSQLENIRLRECPVEYQSIRMYAAGWRTPRVDTLKFVNYTVIENSHKVSKKIFVLLCGCYMYNCWGKRTVTGLCEPLWSIRLNYQLN